MTRSFADSLPSELVTNIRAQFGRTGNEWLEGLPSLIAKLEDRWSLKVREPFPGIEYNYVAPAILQDSQHAVIKIAPPEAVEIFGEAAFLKSRNGIGAVKLIAENGESRAILLERVFPGETLVECFRDSQPGAVEPAIKVLQAILRPVPDDTVDIIRLDDWWDGLRRYSSTSFPKNYAIKALDIYEKLSLEPARIFYLHGDFHPANFVSAERSPFLVIDPKGLIGHIGYEIAVFLNNFHWWQETKVDIRERLHKAIDQFSKAFHLSHDELRQWAYAQMVLSAWWTFDEMPTIYSNEVAKADIWDV